MEKNFKILIRGAPLKLDKLLLFLEQILKSVSDL